MHWLNFVFSCPKIICIKGAAALVCEHSFSQKIATGHPDTKDFKQIDVFLGQVLKNIQRHKTLSCPIPGDPNAPYYIPKGIDGKPVNFLKAKPVTDTKLCNQMWSLRNFLSYAVHRFTRYFASTRHLHQVPALYTDLSRTCQIF